MASRFPFATFTSAIGLVLGVSACEGDNTLNTQTIAPPVTSCSAGQAEILVQDGFLEDLCGCAEGDAVVYNQPQPLTCTISSSTTVFFLFAGSELSHQILSVGTPFFVSSPLWDPSNSTTTNSTFAYQFMVPGTYEFKDAINPAMTGSIVVQ
ncbi:MAG: hypothetical protein P4M08_01280 [Oligoflexia bacterium]|nr:hypothetical protein [Oligoflexia bacterium]